MRCKTDIFKKNHQETEKGIKSNYNCFSALVKNSRNKEMIRSARAIAIFPAHKF